MKIITRYPINSNNKTVKALGIFFALPANIITETVFQWTVVLSMFLFNFTFLRNIWVQSANKCILFCSVIFMLSLFVLTLLLSESYLLKENIPSLILTCWLISSFASK